MFLELIFLQFSTMATTDIIFDVKTVDTQLAEVYINTISELHSIGFTENGSYEYDIFKNKIYIANIDAEPIKVDDNTSHSPDKVFTLAKLIEKNADLFCQLEYLIRKISVEDVKKNDLKLIVDNLLYCNKEKRNEPFHSNFHCKHKIAFLADTPLATLGLLAQSLCCDSTNKNNYLTIISNKDTAIICSLFVDLCHEVGFSKVFLQLVSKDADCSKYNILKMEEMSTGCVGIVTSKCDVDSAVDTFLSSTIWYPWIVKKIFVQECVLERFKRALAWKSEKQQLGRRGGDVEVSCATSYRCGDKVFVLEATGECGPCVVALEVYRTVRELLTLVGALRPLAASLWCSDVAESLEIAHGLSATVVWVNAFADFRGPPRVSQAFYSVIDSYFSTQMMQYMPEFDQITKLRDSWLRLNVDERKDLVRNALSKIDDEEAKGIIEAVETLTFEVDSFVYVTKDMISTGIELLPEIILPYYYHDRLDLSIICYIIKGGAVLLHIPESLLSLKKSSIFYMFYENLRILGGPVLFSKEDYKHGTIPILRNPVYRKKVIWTSYGTIFAN